MILSIYLLHSVFVGNLYHWRSKNIGFQTQLPWNLFFDILSLQKYIPVIETYQFLQGI